MNGFQRPWATWVLVVATVGYLAAVLVSAGTDVRGPPLAVIVAAAAMGGGLRAGLTAVAALLGVEAARFGIGTGWLLLVPTLTTLAVMIASTSRALRGAGERAHGAADAMQVLLESFGDASRTEGREAVVRRLPDLVAPWSPSRVRVWRAWLNHVELEIDTSPTSDARIGDRKPIGSDDLLVEVRRARAPGDVADGRRMALPLEEGDAIELLLEVQRDRPFERDEREGLQRVAAAASHTLSALSSHRRAEVGGQLMRLLGAEGELDAALRSGLELLCSELRCSGAAILRYREGYFRSTAVVGSIRDPLAGSLAHGLRPEDGVLASAYQSGAPHFVEDYGARAEAHEQATRSGLGALALVPLSGRPFDKLQLALFQDHARAWGGRTRSLIESAAGALRLLIARADQEQRLERMVALERRLLQRRGENPYQELLETTMAFVPGAEAGSLLVRSEEDARFRFRAAVGFDVSDLEGVPQNDAQALAWHGGSEEDWRAGRPRIIVRDAVLDHSHSSLGDRLREVGRLEHISANLCVPVAHDGRVLATLNLDALHDPHAFQEADVRVAESFAPLVGFVLHEASLRRELEEASRRDALTGLLNRRAFDDAFAAELARASRHDGQLCLLVMDLSGFKRVNDEQGHAAGDEALRSVAARLRSASRLEDLVFRWGGDEFAVLLPDEAPDGARAAAERYASMGFASGAAGRALTMNVGAACFPDDGGDVDTLLKVADRRMYVAKRGGAPMRAAD